MVHYTGSCWQFAFSMRHVNTATGSFRNILFSEVSGLQLETPQKSGSAGLGGHAHKHPEVIWSWMPFYRLGAQTEKALFSIATPWARCSMALWASASPWSMQAVAAVRREVESKSCLQNGLGIVDMQWETGKTKHLDCMFPSISPQVLP